MQGQSKINSEQEINTLRNNHQYYVGKSFNILLNNIQLKIKAYRGGTGYGTPNYLTIYFDDLINLEKMRGHDIQPSVITVFFSTKDKKVNTYLEALETKKNLEYTIKSFEPYENLIVLGIDAYTEK